MRWLVTGASGFLGRHVVARLIETGAEVSALVRPTSDLGNVTWTRQVDLFCGDLREREAVITALSNVDGVIHVAAAVGGNREEMNASTIGATQNLLAAMAERRVGRLIHISSFSVYDWSKSKHRFDETTPLESERLEERDDYAIAKARQESIVRRFADENHCALTVLRPGFIWGRGREWSDALGQRMGKCCVLVGPLRELPMTHVVNCADCVVSCALNDASVGQTFNVIDDHNPNAWQFAGDYLSRSSGRGIRVPLPYHFGLAMSSTVFRMKKLVLGTRGRLPGVLIPRRYVARFKPGRFVNERLCETIAWRPPLSYRAALDQTYPEADRLHSGPDTLAQPWTSNA